MGINRRFHKPTEEKESGEKSYHTEPAAPQLHCLPGVLRVPVEFFPLARLWSFPSARSCNLEKKASSLKPAMFIQKKNWLKQMRGLVLKPGLVLKDFQAPHVPALPPDTCCSGAELVGICPALPSPLARPGQGATWRAAHHHLSLKDLPPQLTQCTNFISSCRVLKPLNKTNTSVDAAGYAHGEMASPVKVSVLNDWNSDLHLLV